MPRHPPCALHSLPNTTPTHTNPPPKGTGSQKIGSNKTTKMLASTIKIPNNTPRHPTRRPSRTPPAGPGTEQPHHPNPHTGGRHGLIPQNPNSMPPTPSHHTPTHEGRDTIGPTVPLVSNPHQHERTPHHDEETPTHHHPRKRGDEHGSLLIAP